MTLRVVEEEIGIPLAVPVDISMPGKEIEIAIPLIVEKCKIVVDDPPGIIQIDRVYPVCKENGVLPPDRMGIGAGIAVKEQAVGNQVPIAIVIQVSGTKVIAFHEPILRRGLRWQKRQDEITLLINKLPGIDTLEIAQSAVLVNHNIRPGVAIPVQDLEIDMERVDLDAAGDKKLPVFLPCAVLGFKDEWKKQQQQNKFLISHQINFPVMNPATSAPTRLDPAGTIRNILKLELKSTLVFWGRIRIAKGDRAVFQPEQVDGAGK